MSVLPKQVSAKIFGCGAPALSVYSAFFRPRIFVATCFAAHRFPIFSESRFRPSAVRPPLRFCELFAERCAAHRAFLRLTWRFLSSSLPGMLHSLFHPLPAELQVLARQVGGPALIQVSVHRTYGDRSPSVPDPTDGQASESVAAPGGGAFSTAGIRI